MAKVSVKSMNFITVVILLMVCILFPYHQRAVIVTSFQVPSCSRQFTQRRVLNAFRSAESPNYVSSTELMDIKEFTGNLGYELVDSGHSLRLERFGNYLVERPCPSSASWTRTRGISEWRSKQRLIYSGQSGKAGSWFVPQEELQSSGNFSKQSLNWTAKFNSNHVMKLQLSENGQVGCFPEQIRNWQWITEQVQNHAKHLQSIGAPTAESIKVLNCFAYTGGSTIAAINGGTTQYPVEVTHVDAAKSFLEWTKVNLALSGLQRANVKFRDDDCMTFLQREIRRGNKYSAIILDPPAFGRASKNKVWKFDRDLELLLDSIPNLLSKDAAFVLLTCHDENLQAQELGDLLGRRLRGSGSLEVGDMIIEAAPRPSGVIGAPLKMGIFAKWSSLKH